MLRIRTFPIQPQKEQKEFEDVIIRFNTQTGNKINHPLVNLPCIDIPINKRKRLKQRKNQITYDDPLTIAIISLSKCHHQYLVYRFYVFIVH